VPTPAGTSPAGSRTERRVETTTPPPVTAASPGGGATRSAPAPSPASGFTARVRPVTASDVRYTYRAGCPVGPSDLRAVEMTYRGYDGVVRTGVLVVATSRASDVVATFRAAFDSGFRIRRMDNPDRWKGDDEAMMAADNTSAFNCRPVTGDPGKLSPHAYGIAIDVNPRRNPYLAANGVWYPDNGSPWIDRTRRDHGMLFTGSPLVTQVLARGGIWGGSWANPDYQHVELR
jgi:hypothetical protein